MHPHPFRLIPHVSSGLSNVRRIAPTKGIDTTGVRTTHL